MPALQDQPSVDEAGCCWLGALYPRSTEWRGPPHSAGHGVWEPKLVLERALTEEMTGAWVMTIMTRLGGEEGRRYRLLFI